MRTIRMQLLSLAVFAAFVAAPQVSHAASITINTGVDATNTVLAPMAIDPFWTISVQGGAFQSAVVAPLADICCGMETVGAQAAWITDSSVSGSATGWGFGAPPGEAGAGPLAIARRTFDLSAFDLATVSLSGLWRVADFRAGIYLNSVLINPATANTDGGMFCNPCNWQVDQAFAVLAGSGLFVQGVNTLELRGSSVNSVFDGFWVGATVEGRLNAAQPVPEPGSMILLGTGIAGVIARRRRARNR